MKLYREIEKSFPVIQKLFSENNLAEFKNAPVGDLCLYHFGLGSWVRDNLLCADENLLYDLFLQNGVEHHDDMSSLIINLFHYSLSDPSRKRPARKRDFCAFR